MIFTDESYRTLGHWIESTTQLARPFSPRFDAVHLANIEDHVETTSNWISDRGSNFVDEHYQLITEALAERENATIGLVDVLKLLTLISVAIWLEDLYAIYRLFDRLRDFCRHLEMHENDSLTAALGALDAHVDSMSRGFCSCPKMIEEYNARFGRKVALAVGRSLGGDAELGFVCIAADQETAEFVMIRNFAVTRNGIDDSILSP